MQEPLFLVKGQFSNYKTFGKGSRKKCFSGPATKALTHPPHPSSKLATFLGGFLLELPKKLFFLSGQVLTSYPLPT